MVSIWLTTVKDGEGMQGNLPHEKNRLHGRKPVFIKSFGLGELIADIAGYGWSAGQPGHADRWKTAKTGIRPPSACSGCKPPRGRADRREPRRRLRPCGGLPTVWFRARASPQLLTDCRQAR